jgi:hypothetical protein
MSRHELAQLKTWRGLLIGTAHGLPDLGQVLSDLAQILV